MRTNLEKYNHYRLEYDSKLDAFIKSYVTKYPDTLYEVRLNGDIFVLKPKKVWYLDTFKIPKKPTKLDIEVLINDTKTIVFDKNQIVFDVDVFTLEGEKQHMQIIRLSMFKDKLRAKTYVTTEHVAQAISLEYKLKKQLDQKLLDGGVHIRCQYCSTIIEKVNAIKGKIYAYKMYGSGGKTFDYCSNNCYFADQCAHD